MQQSWDPSSYSQEGRFVAELAQPLLGVLNPQPGERILDLGCGDGFLTQRIAAAGATVLGVDNSPAMIRGRATPRAFRPLRERRRSAVRRGVRPGILECGAALDGRSESSAEGVRRALKPGGRFVAEMGGHGNIAAIRVALLAVLLPRKVPIESIECNCFCTAAEYRALLEAAGFRVAEISLTPRPTSLPSGMQAWLELFRAGLLEQLPPGERAAAIEECVELLKPVLCDREGKWTADYVRLRFVARRT